MKKSKCKKNGALYTKGRLKTWYIYNYENLGSDWLIKYLKDIISNRPDGIVFLSPSANKGLYEREAFEELVKSFEHLKFIIGDISAKDLLDKENDIIIKSSILKYVKENISAAELDYKNEIDVILDNKGALWYCFCEKSKKKKKRNAISLLEKYMKYLKNEDSVLMIDCYETKKFHSLKSIRNIFKYFLFRGNMLQKKFTDYKEKSTFYYLNKVFKMNKETRDLFVMLEPVLIKSKTQNMQIAKISKGNLEILLKKLYQTL